MLRDMPTRVSAYLDKVHPVIKDRVGLEYAVKVSVSVMMQVQRAFERVRVAKDDY